MSVLRVRAASVCRRLNAITLQVLLLGPLALLMSSGCGSGREMDYSQIDLVDVSGVVTLDGDPVGDALVTFEEIGTGTFSFALTDESGYYSLRFDTNQSGVTPGTKRVEISTTRRIPGLNVEDDGEAAESEADGEDAPAAKAEELVPECYNRQSVPTVDVTSSEEFNFDLRSDCSTTGPTN